MIPTKLLTSEFIRGVQIFQPHISFHDKQINRCNKIDAADDPVARRNQILTLDARDIPDADR